MNRRHFIALTASALPLSARPQPLLAPSAGVSAAARPSALDPQPRVLPLWPPRGEAQDLPAEREGDVTKPTDRLVAGRPVVRLSHITEPTLTIYRPTTVPDTGTAVMVCPGGGYHVLAWDLEGTEICEWLNSLGITAGLLKYRVPRAPEGEKHAHALPDARRGMQLLRQQLEPQTGRRAKVGALGFSAGGHLVATLSAGVTARSETTVDAMEAATGRPDFLILVYPAYLTAKPPGGEPAPEIAPTQASPPTFVIITQDDGDRAEDALAYAAALKRAGVPTTLHYYPVGGHGYGLRRTADLVTTWPERAAEWLRTSGWIR